MMILMISSIKVSPAALGGVGVLAGDRIPHEYQRAFVQQPQHVPHAPEGRHPAT
jgi:hypothetical protein